MGVGFFLPPGSNLVLNEGMGERVVQTDPFGRIDGQSLLQQIFQLGHLLQLVGGQSLTGHQFGLQVPVYLHHRHNHNFFLKDQKVYMCQVISVK